MVLNDEIFCISTATQKVSDQAIPIPRKTLTAVVPVTLPMELSAVSSWKATKVSGLEPVWPDSNFLYGYSQQ